LAAQINRATNHGGSGMVVADGTPTPFADGVWVDREPVRFPFSDRAAARRSLDQVLAHSIDRLVMGHGASLTTGGREALATAYNWLR
jgi:hypothetical protein